MGIPTLVTLEMYCLREARLSAASSCPLCRLCPCLYLAGTPAHWARVGPLRHPKLQPKLHVDPYSDPDAALVGYLYTILVQPQAASAKPHWPTVVLQSSPFWKIQERGCYFIQDNSRNPGSLWTMEQIIGTHWARPHTGINCSWQHRCILYTAKLLIQINGFK